LNFDEINATPNSSFSVRNIFSEDSSIENKKQKVEDDSITIEPMSINDNPVNLTSDFVEQFIDKLGDKVVKITLDQIPSTNTALSNEFKEFGIILVDLPSNNIITAIYHYTVGSKYITENFTECKDIQFKKTICGTFNVIILCGKNAYYIPGKVSLPKYAIVAYHNAKFYSTKLNFFELLLTNLPKYNDENIKTFLNNLDAGSKKENFKKMHLMKKYY